MSNKEHIRNDLVVAFDFIGQILKNPALLEKIPDGADITFLDDENLKTERQIKSFPKKYIKVKRQFEIL